MRCEWLDGNVIQCSDNGEHIIVYGCIDQHLNEIIFCPNHILIWETIAEENRAYCPKDNCSNHIADWTSKPLANTTTRWYLERTFL